MAEIAVEDAVLPPLVRVELFEDRAAVTRRVAVPQGRHQLVLGPLTPLVSERALSFPGGTAVTVEEVTVQRVRRTRRAADPAELAPLQAEHSTAQERAAVAAAALVRAREQISRLQTALDSALAASPRALLEQDASRWTDAVLSLASARARAEEKEVELRLEHEDRLQDLARLERDLQLARAGHPVTWGFLALGVWASEATELLVRYVVPCALWRPAHRAELWGTGGPEGKTPRISWEIGAVCWNATGEDWEDVELVCSTARPGDLAQPPQLLDDVIQTERRERVVEAREETISVAREKTGTTAPQIPGVDDGGEPRTFTAPERVRLPSDGRPVTVRLDQWQSDASMRWLALPERAGQAVLRTVQRNMGTRPLLAGPVSLVRDGMSIGRGQIPLVPPGEPFPLGFGSHDGLRISRRRDHEVDRTLITGHQKHQFTVSIRVAHLGHEPCRLEVKERLPTSELKEVGVSPPLAEPALDAPVDADGFVRWTLDLQPGDQRTLKLVYTVDAPGHVTLPF